MKEKRKIHGSIYQIHVFMKKGGALAFFHFKVDNLYPKGTYLAHITKHINMVSTHLARLLLNIEILYQKGIHLAHITINIVPTA